MKSRVSTTFLLSLLSLWLIAPAAAQSPDAGAGGVAMLLAQLERALQTGSQETFLRLLSEDPGTRDRAIGFLEENTLDGATRVVVHEADRTPLRGLPEGDGYRIMIEILNERGDQGRVATWRFDLHRDEAADAAEPRWTIVDQERLTFVEGLYRLSVDETTQYRVRNLTVMAEDLTLTLPEGNAFGIRTEQGTTGMILQGRGTLSFTPTPASEREQMRIFAGSDVLDVDFDGAFIRLNPQDYGDVLTGVLTEQPVNRRDLSRAQAMFEKYAPESFVLDLGVLSQDQWWVLPNFGDFLADVETRRYDRLTYLHTGADPEDIKVFDRAGNRLISAYPSRAKLATRGRFYSDDDDLDYDVLDHYVDVSFFPERQWIQGAARLRIRALSNLSSIAIRLADDLTVTSISSYPFGRLLALRAPGQNSILLNFPTTVTKDFEFLISVTYSGKLPPEMATHQSLGMRDQPFVNAPFFKSRFPAENPRPNYLYTNRSYWYPQSKVSDYATATLRVTVPPGFGCVSSGELRDGSPTTITGDESDVPQGSRRCVFVATQPVRYLSTVISELERGDSRTLELGDALVETTGEPAPRGTGVFYDSLELAVESNVRHRTPDLDPTERAADMVTFFTSLIGDVPYQSLTIAQVESSQPGGHSPAYFSLVNRPTQTSAVLWSRDPVYFHEVPDFFLAHEIAHQWWGQAIGWANYHEQWLSEGFAHYFAALYAKRTHGDEVFTQVIRQMRDWAIEHSDQGPIYLGYRLGHIQDDEQIFRSIIYNKAAAVIHMLRRQVGDEAFFNGLRQFYSTWRFKKAGSEDLRMAPEAASGQSLERFFEGWVYGSAIPQLTFSYRVEQPGGAATEHGPEAILRFEQAEPAFDLPVTVTLKYDSGRSEDVIVRVGGARTEHRVPLVESLRSIETNRDFAAIARIDER